MSARRKPGRQAGDEEPRLISDDSGRVFALFDIAGHRVTVNGPAPLDLACALAGTLRASRALAGILRAARTRRRIMQP